jgi:hypothetical protein
LLGNNNKFEYGWAIAPIKIAIWSQYLHQKCIQWHESHIGDTNPLVVLYNYDICEGNYIFAWKWGSKEAKIDKYEPFLSHFGQLILWNHEEMWPYFLIKIPLTNAGTLTYIWLKLQFGCHGNILLGNNNKFECGRAIAPFKIAISSQYLQQECIKWHESHMSDTNS